MSITQQHMIDAYRAAQHGGPTPPPPGAHTWTVVGELRDYGRFRAVIAGRPVHGRLRAALARRLFAHRSPAGGR